MAEPIELTSASPRFSLPFLFSGQSQKELTVNEAHARIDALLHPAIEGESNAPPASPQDGECRLVGANPTGAWAGHAGDLACFDAGDWQFVAPRDGMCLLDRSTGQTRLFRGGWSIATAPAKPVGGGTVDSQARAAIVQLIAALAAAGILPE